MSETPETADKPAPQLPRVYCPRRSCRSDDIAQTGVFSVSVTGCRTHFFICKACFRGFYARWAPNIPGVWVALDILEFKDQLVKKWLRRLDLIEQAKDYQWAMKHQPPGQTLF